MGGSFQFTSSPEVPSSPLAFAIESIPHRAGARISALYHPPPKIHPPRRKFIIEPMKAHVYVTLKRTVLDAQGQTVAGALRRMGLNGVADVRQGKYFLLTLEDSLASNPAAAQLEVERIAREVLTNPVIEEFSLRLEP